jgi:hypothetical protein
VSLSVDWAVNATCTKDTYERERQPSNVKKSELIDYFVNTVVVYLNLYSNAIKLATLLA